MSVSKAKSAQGIVALYNTKIKRYADGSLKVKMFSYNVSKGLCRKNRESGGVDDNTKDRLRYNNLYNSRSNLIDLVYHNALIKPWQYFVTLTFDPQEVDSLDYVAVSTALAKWTDNMKHQNPNMAYVLVPELHKSGRIHWHGVFRDVPNWKLERARNPETGRLIYKHGVPIYNLLNYKYGHTTISMIRNQEAVSVYCSKYMTKSLINLNYKKRYWSSRNLERPSIEYATFDEATKKFYIESDFAKDLYKSEYSAIFSLSKEVNIIRIMRSNSSSNKR